MRLELLTEPVTQLPQHSPVIVDRFVQRISQMLQEVVHNRRRTDGILVSKYLGAW